MSGNDYCDDDEGIREILQLIELLETEYIRQGCSENPADSECAENSKPVGFNEEYIQIYLRKQLSEASGLSRNQLQALSAQTLCILYDQHIIVDELVRKLNKRKHDLACLEKKYNDLEAKKCRIENDIISTLASMHNRDTVQFHRNCRNVGVQTNLDDESSSPHEAISTGGEQIAISEDKPIAALDTALAGEETPNPATEPSSPKE